MSALGIAGKDGTIKYRFEGTDAVGRLRAKTGTLENVSALSGYVQAVGGERFVFSFLVNDFAGRPSTVVQHIDALGAAVASSGSKEGPSAAIASLTPPSVVGPLGELVARMKTYQEIGNKADRRNQPFLRTTWRAEKDPAVRALIAEALYQSDPRESASVRMLLDSTSASEDVFGRLRKAAKELKAPLPLVQSMTELGASGNSEAIARLVELTKAAASDEEDGPLLSDALATVANESPFETLGVVRGLSTADREGTLDELSKGMCRAAQPDAPLWAQLKTMQGSPEPSVVDFARAVEIYLSQKIAEAKAPVGPDGGPIAAPPAPEKGAVNGVPGGGR
jgi:D-alanyl-D-alanine carboxypeptidase/D-alanyl-D-alanine-endopeptidase (penicillin-binding protein 4)